MSKDIIQLKKINDFKHRDTFLPKFKLNVFSVDGDVNRDIDAATDFFGLQKPRVIHGVLKVSS